MVVRVLDAHQSSLPQSAVPDFTAQEYIFERVRR
jgi:hypothetical protein